MAIQVVGWSEAAAPCSAGRRRWCQVFRLLCWCQHVVLMCNGASNTRCVVAAGIQKVTLPSLAGCSEPNGGMFFDIITTDHVLFFQKKMFYVTKTTFLVCNCDGCLIAATCGQAAASENEDNQTAAQERLTTSRVKQQQFWKRLQLVELKKLCHHCMKHRWQHARVPVCVGCQPQLGRISCRHCGDQVFEHRLLAKAESLVAATVCLSCAKALIELGLPTRCDICCRWSAFGSTRYCRRCTDFTSLYGAPTTCMRCGINAAFYREPEKMSKVGNQLLCFVCTVAFKKEKYNEEKKRQRPVEKAHVMKDLPLSPSCAFCAEKMERVCSLQCDLMNEKKKADVLAQQVKRLEEEIKQKETHLTSVIEQIEREHVLVREKLQVMTTHRRTVRDENRVTQLLKQVSDLDRAHAKEVALLIEGNQEERQKLNELFEKIQAKHQTLQAEVERQRLALENTTAELKEERKASEHYKEEATRCVEQASQKFEKIIKKLQERLQAAKKTIRHLKQRTASAECSSDKQLPVFGDRNAEQSEFLLHASNDHDEDSTTLDSVSSALYELLSQPPSIMPNCDTESAPGSSKRIRWSEDERCSSSDAHSRWPTANS